MKTMPGEAWSRIGLATGCDIAMTCHCLDRIATSQCSQQPIKREVLGIVECKLVAAFKLDANREIVATISPHPAGDTRVPGTPDTGNELDQLAIAPDQEVRRNTQALYLTKVGMSRRVELVGEQGDNSGSTELAWRQADGVDDDQPHRFPQWSLVTIW
jgi:hypothetical protein